MFGEGKIIWKLIVLVIIIALGLLFIYFKNKDNTKKSIDSFNSNETYEKISI